MDLVWLGYTLVDKLWFVPGKFNIMFRRNNLPSILTSDNCQIVLRNAFLSANNGLLKKHQRGPIAGRMRVFTKGFNTDLRLMRMRSMSRLATSAITRKGIYRLSHDLPWV